MANKVISIKLDEKDIKRIKRYHEALKGLGIVSERTLTMNGLYKHLLLDYLEEDIQNMVSSCSKCGLLPRYITPEEVNTCRASFVNPYNLDEELYAIYLKCIMDAQVSGLDRIEENIRILNEVANTDVCSFDKTYCTYQAYPYGIGEYESGEVCSFWVDKAIAEHDLKQREYQKEQRDEYDMIRKASVSQEDKERLIKAIEKFKENKKRHYAMLEGRMI